MSATNETISCNSESRGKRAVTVSNNQSTRCGMDDQIRHSSARLAS